MAVEITPDFSGAPDPEKYMKSRRRLGRLANFLWNVHVIGIERIPMEGAAILAFSHRSYTEIFLQGVVIPRAMRAMMKKEVKIYPILGNYLAARGIFFVDRAARNKTETLRKAHSYLEEGQIVDMNPEGTSKNRGPQLGELHEGVADMAVRAAKRGIKCPIIPIGMASERLWLRPWSRIPVVIGYPFYPQLEGRSYRQARDETHVRLEENLQTVFSLALAIK